MLKPILAAPVFFLLSSLLPQYAVAQEPPAAWGVNNVICDNKDGAIDCKDKSMREVAVRYGEPVSLEVEYLGYGDLFEEPVVHTFTKTLPKDILPLTFRHTVRALSSFQAAKNGTATSPYGEYRAYDVGAARREYEVNVDISKENVLIYSYTLSADQPSKLFTAGEKPIVTRILGEDLVPVKNGVPAGSILFVPVKQDGTLLPVYEGLLLPRADAAEIIDARQLNQLRDADLDLIAVNPNAEADYLVKYKLAFKDSITAMGNALMLVQQVNDGAFTTLYHETDLAKIQALRFAAIGFVDIPFNPPFEAMSSHGKLKVDIVNWGIVSAGYELTVHDCAHAPDMPPMVTGAYYLAPNEMRTIVLDLPTNFAVGIENAYCWVSLKSVSGELFDETKVFVDTTSSDMSRVQY
ncbi:MAG TPA: hypothetical protein PLV42_11765 [bacterium]|nr:hypothetical protein [bacterium]